MSFTRFGGAAILGGKTAWGVGATTMALTVGGLAGYAYWTTTGSGTGTTNDVGTSSAVTISQTVSSTDLTPGGGADPLTYTITNSSTGYQFVSAVNVAVTDVKNSGGTSVFANGTASADHATTCGPDDFTISQPATGTAAAQTGATYNIPPGTTVTFHPGAGTNDTDDRYATGLDIALNNMATINQNGCKDTTVTLTFTAS